MKSAQIILPCLAGCSIAAAAPWDEWTLNVNHIKADTIRSPGGDSLLIGAVVLTSGSNVPLTGTNTPIVRNTTFTFVRMGEAHDGQVFQNMDPFSGQVIQIYPGDQFQLSIILLNQGASSQGSALANLIGGMVNTVATIVGTATGIPAIGTVTSQITSAIEGALKNGCDGVLLQGTMDVTDSDIAAMDTSQIIQGHFFQYGGEHTGGALDMCNPSDQHYDVNFVLTRVSRAQTQGSFTPAGLLPPVVTTTAGPSSASISSQVATSMVTARSGILFASSQTSNSSIETTMTTVRPASSLATTSDLSTSYYSVSSALPITSFLSMLSPITASVDPIEAADGASTVTSWLSDSTAQTVVSPEHLESQTLAVETLQADPQPSTAQAIRPTTNLAGVQIPVATLKTFITSSAYSSSSLSSFPVSSASTPSASSLSSSSVSVSSSDPRVSIHHALAFSLAVLVPIWAFFLV